MGRKQERATAPFLERFLPEHVFWKYLYLELLVAITPNGSKFQNVLIRIFICIPKMRSYLKLKMHSL